MPEFWKTKFYATFFLILFSLYFLLPTFLDLKTHREEALVSGADRPWYAFVLPDNVLNLGLDLQGGLYLELEVGIAQALNHQFSFLVSDLKRYVLKDNLAEAQATELGRGFVRIELAKDKWGALQSRLQDTFGNEIFATVSEVPELFFEIRSDFALARKKGLEALQVLENFQGDFLPLKEGKVFAVPFFSEAQRVNFLRVLTTEEMKKDFLLTEAPSVFYLQTSEGYQEKLKKDIVEQAAKAVRNRIDRFGVVEASVSRQSGDRLVVELPGVKNPDNIINIIRKTGKLEFRLVNDSLPLPRLEQLIAEKSKESVVTTPYEEEGLKKLNQVLKADLPEGTEVAYSLDRDPLTKKVLRAGPYLIEEKASVTGDMLDNAKVETQNNLPYVSMSFNKTGAKSFGEVTSQNVGKRLAILLDGVVMSAPVIKSAILGGEAQIELGFGRYKGGGAASLAQRGYEKLDRSFFGTRVDRCRGQVDLDFCDRCFDFYDFVLPCRGCHREPRPFSQRDFYFCNPLCFSSLAHIARDGWDCTHFRDGG